jgi:hypothetical protein
MLTRRAVVAGLAAVVVAPIPALPAPAPRYFRHFFPPVLMPVDPVAYLDMLRIVEESDWRYQSVGAEDDLQGVVWHLPTGFAFYTFPEKGPFPDPRQNFHRAYRLFAQGESLSASFGKRRDIARAATWVASCVEDIESGSFYLPRDFDALHAVQRPAPPFIVSRAPIGFLLDATPGA